MTTYRKYLYLWVLFAILVGGLIGVFSPDVGVSLKPLGDGFIALIKLLVGPIIFCTVVLGVSGGGSAKKMGRVGGKALLYFEVVSTFALAIGLGVSNLLKPGSGFNVDVATLDPALTAEYVHQAKDFSAATFLLHLIPKTFMDAFTGSGDLVQILLVALLFGYGLNQAGKRGQPIHDLIESLFSVLAKVVAWIMYFAPIGAGGAMAFTIGKFGIHSIRPLLSLMGNFYLTCGIFIFVVLGLISRYAGFSLFRFLVYLKDELFMVLGTSSSESAIAPLMEKLERLGCSKSVVGIVVPAGYSFNLDGTNIYLTMAVLFLAQALNIDLSLGQQMSILGVAMLTSKGASGITGAGFITLAATLAVVPSIPVASIALILGIDRFMSEARALTNFIGNGVATIVVAKWENELDGVQLRKELTRNS